MICVGLDAGSRAIKVVLLDGDSGDVLAADAINQGVRQEELAVGLLDRALTEQNLRRENVARILLGAVARRGQAQQREADPSDNVVPAELSKPQEAHVSNGGSMPPLKRRER